jgi:hypothetical protein
MVTKTPVLHCILEKNLRSECTHPRAPIPLLLWGIDGERLWPDADEEREPRERDRILRGGLSKTRS